MPNTAGPQATTDPVFFFSIVQIQVEGILFGIPNYVCEQSKSESFRAIATAAQPYVLEDVTAAEFRDFLRCLIAPPSRADAATGGEEPTESDDDAMRAAYMTRWMNAIKLATRWNFEDARCAAIRKISAMDDPPLKLAVACKYDVPKFLPDALRDLANTKVMTPLIKEDYEILGFDLALKVNQFREGWNARHDGVESSDYSEEDRRHQLIETVFGAEFLKDVKEEEDAQRPQLSAPMQRPVPPGRRRTQRG